MVADRDLRALLGEVSAQIGHDASRAERALVQGRRLHRRQRIVASLTSAAVVAGSTIAATVVLSAGSAAAPAVAAVTCSPHAAMVSAPAVAAGRGGARLEVVNSTGQPVQIVADGQGAYVAPGRTRLDLRLAPGSHAVSCVSDTDVHTARLQVVDHQHIYTPARLACAAPTTTDYSARVLIRQGSAIALTRQLFRAAPSQRVSILGYPASSARTVAVSQGGLILATATWHELASEGLWTLGVVHRC